MLQHDVEHDMVCVMMQCILLDQMLSVAVILRSELDGPLLTDDYVQPPASILPVNLIMILNKKCLGCFKWLLHHFILDYKCLFSFLSCIKFIYYKVTQAEIRVRQLFKIFLLFFEPFSLLVDSPDRVISYWNTI